MRVKTSRISSNRNETQSEEAERIDFRFMTSQWTPDPRNPGNERSDPRKKVGYFQYKYSVCQTTNSAKEGDKRILYIPGIHSYGRKTHFEGSNFIPI